MGLSCGLRRGVSAELAAAGVSAAGAVSTAGAEAALAESGDSPAGAAGVADSAAAVSVAGSVGAAAGDAGDSSVSGVAPSGGVVCDASVCVASAAGGIEPERPESAAGSSRPVRGSSELIWKLSCLISVCPHYRHFHNARCLHCEKQMPNLSRNRRLPIVELCRPGGRPCATEAGDFRSHSSAGRSPQILTEPARFPTGRRCTSLR